MDCSRRDFCFAAGLGLGAGAALLTRAVSDATPNLLRPPGAGTEQEFLAACSRCGLCVTACPYDTLKLADLASGLAAGTPYFDDRAKPCYLCEHGELKCIAACPTDALTEVEIPDIRIGTAVIDEETCLAYNKVTCRVCWHACPFPFVALKYNAKLQPVVDADKCIGCGLCVHACLTEEPAIVVKPKGAPGATGGKV